MSVTATAIEINVTTDSRISTVTSMQGTEIKQNMKGFTVARRWYNRNNGLLLQRRIYHRYGRNNGNTRNKFSHDFKVSP